MTLQIDGVLDLETEHWDTFVVGCCRYADGTVIAERNPDIFYDALFEKPAVLWTWNGGLYDTLWLLDMAVQRGDAASCTLAGTRVVRAQIGPLTIRDACALVPMSLAKAAQIAGARKDETGLACICGQNCGGYCAIRVGMSAADYRAVTEYCVADCDVSLAVLGELARIADGYGYELRGTIGMSSLTTAARDCGFESIDWDWREYNYARSGYYGGRVECYRPRAPDLAHRYDIHSAYPAALSRLDLPVGESISIGKRRAVKAYTRQRDGIYQATVTVPEGCYVPPLPVRIADRSAYPTGQFRGHWARPELVAAECAGADVRIESGLVWEDSEPICKPFVDRVWSHRASVGPSSALGKWLKLFANSLTGKFAQSPDSQTVEICPDPAKIRACEGFAGRGGAKTVRGGCTDTRCTGRCRAWQPLDPEAHVWARPTWRIGDHAYPHWAAYLTAATRVQWVDLARQQGAELIYGDTDSIYSTRPNQATGDDLGDWGYDGPMTDWSCYAPKVYTYTDPRTGERRGRGKGLPRATPEQIDAWGRGGEPITIDRGVRGLRSAARAGDGLFVAKTTERGNHADGIRYGSRMLRGERTYPRDYDALKAEWE